jgi:hypothetical protein
MARRKKPDNTATSTPKAPPQRDEKGRWLPGTPSPNPAGAPKRGQSWAETIRRITDMTRDELIAHVGGEKTALGRQLKELPPGVPMKDAVILIGLIGFGRDPQASMFNALANREEGMPRQTVQHEGALDISKTQGMLDKAYGDDA